MLDDICKKSKKVHQTHQTMSFLEAFMSTGPCKENMDDCNVDSLLLLDSLTCGNLESQDEESARGENAELTTGFCWKLSSGWNKNLR